MPTRQAGQAPTAIIAGGMMIFVAPQLGAYAVACGTVPQGVYPGGGGGNAPCVGCGCGCGWGGGGTPCIPVICKPVFLYDNI